LDDSTNLGNIAMIAPNCWFAETQPFHKNTQAPPASVRPSGDNG